MEPLAKLLVSFIELAETELTLLKQGLVRLALGIVMVIGAGVVGVIGLCWVLEAIFLWLEKLTNHPTALAICGVVFLAAAAILILQALSTVKKAKVSPAAATPGSPDGAHHDPAVEMRIAS